MKIHYSLFALLFIFLFSCSNEYETTTAKVINLETNYGENGNFKATIEYKVDSMTYTDSFEITVIEMVEDSIMTPAVGTEFDIQYNPANPQENKIEFKVKPTYINIKQE